MRLDLQPRHRRPESHYRLGEDGPFRIHGSTYTIIDPRRRFWDRDTSLLAYILQPWPKDLFAEIGRKDPKEVKP